MFVLQYNISRQYHLRWVAAGKRRAVNRYAVGSHGRTLHRRGQTATVTRGVGGRGPGAPSLQCEYYGGGGYAESETRHSREAYVLHRPRLRLEQSENRSMSVNDSHCARSTRSWKDRTSKPGLRGFATGAGHKL